jgi:dipeptidyl aminopeptidase/acylaminoacyl peptidase
MSGRSIPTFAAFRLMILICGLLFSLPLMAAGPSADSLRLQLHPPQPLTADLTAEISPALSPNQEFLVYASRASGNYDIWIRPLDGGIAVPLTDHPADDYSPQWSANGKTIAFVSQRDDLDGDILALYLDQNRLRASKIVPLVEDPGPQGFPSYSCNGRYLVYQDGVAQQARLVLLDLRHRKKTVLTNPGYLQPRFSPVDDRVLCLQACTEESPGAICIIQLHDPKNPTPEIEVVYDGIFPAASPVWSPDGKSFVAALTNQDLDGDGLLTYLDRSQLYRFDPAGDTFQYRLLVPGDSRETYPFWGTDDFIYFSSDKRGNFDLYRLPGEGAIPPAVSARAGFEFALSISGSRHCGGKLAGIRPPIGRDEGAG